MEKVAYIGLDDYVKDIYEIDCDDISDIMWKIESYIKNYKGVQFKGDLYRFDIERITDLIYDIIQCYKENHPDKIIIIPMDKRYFLVLSDTIKYLYNNK